MSLDLCVDTPKPKPKGFSGDGVYFQGNDEHSVPLLNEIDRRQKLRRYLSLFFLLIFHRSRPIVHYSLASLTVPSEERLKARTQREPSYVLVHCTRRRVGRVRMHRDRAQDALSLVHVRPIMGVGIRSSMYALLLLIRRINEHCQCRGRSDKRRATCDAYRQLHRKFAGQPLMLELTSFSCRRQTFRGKII